MAMHQPTWRPQTHQPITWSWMTYGYVIYLSNCILHLLKHLGLFWQATIRLGPSMIGLLLGAFGIGIAIVQGVFIRPILAQIGK